MYGTGQPYWVSIKGVEHLVTGKRQIRDLLIVNGIDPYHWREYAMRGHANPLWFWA